jgi:1,4-alpha-glucan branching enzyme
MSPKTPPITNQSTSLLTDDDLYLFNEGTHHRLYEKMGSHLIERNGQKGAQFAVWAPNAERVSVVGSFNDWNKQSHPLQSRGESGVWEGFIPDIGQGTIYKYHIESRYEGYQADKADPFAVHHETSPKTASIVWETAYQWSDSDWMKTRGERNAAGAPMSVYEMHLGSWRRIPEDDNRSLSYREMAAPLAEHVKKLGFTHVEFMPVMEHPFYGSWGYQVTGFFAPTSRYGTPQDFMYLIDVLHQNGIGVILDWVPSHFPTDEHGLGYFDGTHLFEHADAKKGFHPDWSSFIFNYGRNEVRSFLLSSAMCWLDLFHADGLRVDAVASMLYLDYSRKAGEWIPNRFGGHENLEAISFLRRFNEDVYKNHPDVQTAAEESTSWPMVSRPTYLGGLGFGMKWDMGWMHDTLRYMSREPIHRQFLNGVANLIIPDSSEEYFSLEYFGHAYKEGAEWLTLNAEANSRIFVPIFRGVPKQYLSQSVEDGSFEEFEDKKSPAYLMFITRVSRYEDFIEQVEEKYFPVFEIKRQKGTLLKIYKNDEGLVRPATD